MDIFPFSFESPVRLYAEWDEIGRIAYYDPMTQKSIKEIACELEFPNLSFFGKYVKKHLGMSPKAYRELSLEE